MIHINELCAQIAASPVAIYRRGMPPGAPPEWTGTIAEAGRDRPIDVARLAELLHVGRVYIGDTIVVRGR